MTKVKKMGNIYGYTGGNFGGNVYESDGLSPTLLNMGGGGNKQPMILDEKPAIRIRKLTPRETWRLMGFSDQDFDKAQKVNSNTQLYKQAGNSIVVPVLEAIFGQMLGDDND